MNNIILIKFTLSSQSPPNHTPSSSFLIPWNSMQIAASSPSSFDACFIALVLPTFLTFSSPRLFTGILPNFSARLQNLFLGLVKCTKLIFCCLIVQFTLQKLTFLKPTWLEFTSQYFLCQRGRALLQPPKVRTSHFQKREEGGWFFHQ